MTGPEEALWLAVGAVGDPEAIEPDERRLMARAGRVEVAPDVSPAMALWADPDRVQVAARDQAWQPDMSHDDRGVVWIAVAPPGPDVVPGLDRSHPGWRAVTPAADARAGEDARALDGATLVMTRAWDDQRAEAGTFAAWGARLLPWPLSEPAPTPAPEELRAAARRLATGGYAALGVTSARAARALAAALVSGPGMPASRPFIGAVGEATAAALAEVGLPAHMEVSGGGAELGQALGRKAWGRSVLLVQAAGGRPEAAQAVRTAGAKVDVVAAYAMIEPAFRRVFDGRVLGALESADAAHVYMTWYSPQALERGLAVLGSALRRATWVVVGQTTGAAAHRHGAPAGGIVVAAQPTTRSVALAVRRTHAERAARRTGA